MGVTLYIIIIHSLATPMGYAWIVFMVYDTLGLHILIANFMNEHFRCRMHDSLAKWNNARAVKCACEVTIIMHHYEGEQNNVLTKTSRAQLEDIQQKMVRTS